MARSRAAEQSRSRSKSAQIEELTYSIGKFQEVLKAIDDFSQEGFPYRDAARAKAELQFKECVRRTFGERSQEFQTYRNFKLRTADTTEAAQSLATIKGLIQTLEDQKLDLQGLKPPPKPRPSTEAGMTNTARMMLVSPTTQTGVAPQPTPPMTVTVAMTTNVAHPNSQALPPVASKPAPPTSQSRPVVQATATTPESTVQFLAPRPSPPKPSPTPSLTPAPPPSSPSQLPLPAQPSPPKEQTQIQPVANEPSLTPTPPLTPPHTHTGPSTPASTPSSQDHPSPSAPSATSPFITPISAQPVASEPSLTPTSMSTPAPPSAPPQSPIASSTPNPLGSSDLPPLRSSDTQEAKQTLPPSQPTEHPGHGSSGIQTHPTETTQDPLQLVRKVCLRLHAAARQLRLRRDYRPTLAVEDDYDLQDLLCALLRVEFDEVTIEEWTPPYTEGAPRTTLLVHKDQIAIVAKKTRPGLTPKDLADQVTADSAYYRSQGRCSTLFCFVYDPEGRIGSPKRLESTLTSVSESCTVEVLVAPK